MERFLLKVAYLCVNYVGNMLYLQMEAFVIGILSIVHMKKVKIVQTEWIIRIVITIIHIIQMNMSYLFVLKGYRHLLFDLKSVLLEFQFNYVKRIFK